METRFAKIISYVFHPIVLPLCLLVIILHLDIFHIYIIPVNARWLMIGMAAIGTVAFPLMLILLMLRKGMFSTLRMEQKEERRYPYLIMAVVYYIMYTVFKSVHLPSVVLNLFLGVFILLILALIINVWFKVSVHMASIGGFAGALTGIAFRYLVDLRIIIFTALLIAGLIGFARLKLNSHKPSEVYSGFLMGVAVMLLIYVLN